MAELKEGRILITEQDLRNQMLEGARLAFEAVATTYGPRGKNVAIERGFGRPTYTRDGVTVVEQVFFSDRVMNMGAQALAEASRAANNISGDGSSATVVLAYNLLKNANQAIASGIHPMVVSDMLVKDSQVLLEALKAEVIPVKDEQLKEVATVSSGDPLIGQLIAEAILYVGQDGGILTEKAPISEIQREYVDGYYLQSGFTALQAGKKELVEPLVIVSAKRLTSGADAIELLNKTVEAKFIKPGQVPRIVFIGNIEDMAYNTIVNSVNAGQIDAVIIKTPPMYGELAKHLLDDIALYVGCDLITETTSLKAFNANYIGTVEKVVASKSESTLFGDNQTEAVQTRIQELKDLIASEEVPAFSEKLRDRLAKLEGKIAIFKIGGVNDSIREETEFRLDDAINSTRHAHREGIVPGGGITLLKLSKLSDISDISRTALRNTFQQLLLNANLPAELKLDEALKAKDGYGFDLRNDGKLVSMVSAGIIDPVVVVREAISNALGTASNVTKTALALVFQDTEK